MRSGRLPSSLGSGLSTRDSVDLPVFQRQVVKTLDSECERFSALVYIYKWRVWGRGLIVLSSASSTSGEYLIILGMRLSSTEDVYRAICVVYGSDQL